MTYIPIPFVAPSPDSEVLGQLYLAFIQNLRAEEIQPILKKHGMEDMRGDQWYPVQTILDIYKDIIDGRENVNDELVAIGMKGVDTVPFPPEIHDIPSAINYIDQSSKLYSRNIPDDYGFHTIVVGKKHLHVIKNHPHPTASGYGLIWAVVNRFKGADEVFTVNTFPDEVGKPTIFDVRWGLPEEMEDAE